MLVGTFCHTPTLYLCLPVIEVREKREGRLRVSPSRVIPKERGFWEDSHYPLNTTNIRIVPLGTMTHPLSSNSCDLAPAAASLSVLGLCMEATPGLLFPADPFCLQALMVLQHPGSCPLGSWGPLWIAKWARLVSRPVIPWIPW